MKYFYKVMYYDPSFMDEPKLVETFDDEHRAHIFVHWRYESEFYYVEREMGFKGQ